MSRVAELDLFVTFRTAVFVGLVIYAGLSLSATAWQVVAFFRSDDPKVRWVRRYVTYQLVSMRLSPLAGELFQIALLIAVLGTIWWAHGSLRPAS